VTIRDPLPVLLYHAVYRTDAELRALPRDDQAYAVSGKLLQSHIKCLLGEGYKIIAEPRKAMKSAAKRVLLTFDDSLTTHVAAAEMLADMNVSALFLLCTREIGTAGRIDERGVMALAERGMRLGSHGATHEFLTSMSRERINNDLLSSRELINKWGDAAVNSLSFPGGRYNLQVINAARHCGFNACLSSDNVINDADLNPFTLGRINVTSKIDNECLLALAGRNALPFKQSVFEGVKRCAKRVLGDKAYMACWGTWHGKRLS